MTIPKLQIGNMTADVPIVQGAMGVRVSLSSLVSAVANEGGIGTIASVGLGDLDALEQTFEKECRENLVKEIHKAREKSNGNIAVNVMAALSNADDLIKAAIGAGVEMIVVGAGLPLKLPRLVENNSVNLVPIVSSHRAADLILGTWGKRFDRTADAVILEGPLAGGHLGFSKEQLLQPDKYSLEILLPQVLEVLKPYEDRFGRKIPVIAAGGIYTGQDIARMLSLGASGVQMATRFVGTVECGVSQEFKQAYLDAKEEDITLIQSPVGLPGRAIRNKFLRDLEIEGRFKDKCPYKCLTSCKIGEAKYCIAKALLNSYFGDVDHGLIFAGHNAYRVNRIMTVKDLFAELLQELAAA
ncbi:NAD(P)H-dependent flavin oxidoreductase [Candidatus Neomarinimicrobiota bacterium]